MRSWHFLLMILIFAQCDVKQNVRETKHKIRVLILSGRNNHEWQSTTPQLVKIYEESGRFDVEVTEAPDTLSYAILKGFNAVVSNWSAWPEHDYRWPEAAERGLMKFIEEGGGFVVVHAASATFYDWPEYQNLVGTTWGDSTKHGKIAPHQIVITDNLHPVTNGMADFWITDELWVHAGVNSELNVLAESYSDTANSGRGMMEPALHWKALGKGRMFHSILGHNPRAMKNSGLKTLILRGTEWAASGEVTIPVPDDLSKRKQQESPKYSWHETDTTIALLNNNEIVWQYNYKTKKGKPFFHPVNINGSSITWLSPEDHPWHLGIWHSWKYINGVNYWEYDRSEGVEPFIFLGITEVRGITYEKHDEYSCKLKLEIYYHEKKGPDLLREERVVNVSPVNERGEFSISYQINLVALADTIELNRTPLPHEEGGQSWGGYAGLSVRFSQDLFEPSCINFGGTTTMNHGKSMPWKYYGLRNIKGEPVGAAIFTHPENLNYPEPWFMTDYEDHPFYYFSPSPLFNQPHILRKGEQLNFGYQITFYSGRVGIDHLASDYMNYLEKK
jgi:type 1 glutamine amidotransferase